MIINLENSTIAEEYGSSKEAVDHIFRGFIAGAGVLFFGADTEAVEVKCKAK